MINFVSTFFSKGQTLTTLLVVGCTVLVVNAQAKPIIALDKTVLNNTIALSDNNVVEDEGKGLTEPLNSNQTSSNSNVLQNESNKADDISSVLPKDAETLSSSEIPLGAVAPITIQRFTKVIDTVRRNYVQPVSDETLFNHATAGVLASLDPYSEYLDPQAYNNLRLFTEGDMGSIGVKVQFDNTSQHWVFSEVLTESPAAKAGIQVGDYLHQINDNKLQQTQTQQDITQLLSGIAGTQLKLVVSTQGRRKHLVVMQRSLVQQQSIEANIINGIALIHIPIFQNNTQPQLLEALANTHQPFNAIIIDLRNNPGGVLKAASDVASLFMQDKKLAIIHDRNGIKEEVMTHGKAQLPTLPLIILQNRYSASAAEVLASSLQENGRAKIFGETSYGKGSIQSVLPISDNDAIKLTVAHYYSSQGKKIDGVGVIPDVTLSVGEATWVGQALNYMQNQARPVRYLLKNDKNIQEF